MTLTVVGHTDSIGDDTSNLVLSLQRAQAVTRWLTDRGIEPDFQGLVIGPKPPCRVRYRRRKPRVDA